MRSTALICTALAVVLGGTSASGSATKVTRWEVIASVTNGDQILTRISDSSTPKHHGAGSVDSRWSARWKIKVVSTPGAIRVAVTNAVSVAGTAHGEYRGYYPKADGTTGSYTCPIGPIVSRQVLKKLSLYVTGATPAKLTVFFGVNGEPGILPALKCTGDLVEPDAAKTVSAGLLTGIESACYGNVSVAGKSFAKGHRFGVRKKFGWHPPSPAGMSRPCNGVGAPVWSAGGGTLNMTFAPQ